MVVASSTSGLVLLGMAASQTSQHLILLSAIGGASNAAMHPAISLALAESLTERQGLAFGIKQSSVPLATLLAGATVPLIALRYGWRLSLVVLSCATALVSLAIFSFSSTLSGPAITERSKSTSLQASWRPLIGLGLAAGTGIAAANSLGTFVVESAVSHGLSAGASGTLLIFGSLSGIVARVLGGWRIDLGHTDPLLVVARMLFVGSAAYFGIALSRSFVMMGLSIIGAFAFGWGWTGIATFAVVQANPQSPAVATGVLTAGMATGAALGPVLFSFIASSASYSVAWSMAGLLSVGSCVLVLWARRAAHRLEP